MSLRTAIQASSSMRVVTAARCFSASPLRRQEPTAGPSTTSGFGALRDLLSKNPATPSTPTTAAPPTTAAADAAGPTPAPVPFSTPPPAAPSLRGHDPRALPPKTDPVMELFTCMVMRDGKKATAEGTMTNILQMIRETTNQPPIPLLHRAVLLSSPSVRVLSMRKSLKRIDTPRALNERQRTHQAIAWILKASESGRRGGLKREQRIAREILRILEGESTVFKWLEDRHKTATLARSNINAR